MRIFYRLIVLQIIIAITLISCSKNEKLRDDIPDAFELDSALAINSTIEDLKDIKGLYFCESCNCYHIEMQNKYFGEAYIYFDSNSDFIDNISLEYISDNHQRIDSLANVIISICNNKYNKCENIVYKDIGSSSKPMIVPEYRWKTFQNNIVRFMYIPLDIVDMGVRTPHYVYEITLNNELE